MPAWGTQEWIRAACILTGLHSCTNMLLESWRFTRSYLFPESWGPAVAVCVFSSPAQPWAQGGCK